MSSGQAAMWDDFEEYECLCRRFGLQPRMANPGGMMPYSADWDHLAVLRHQAAMERRAPRWRHKKRGSTYIEMGRGPLRIAQDAIVAEGDELLAYRDANGNYWFESTIDLPTRRRTGSEIGRGRLQNSTSRGPIGGDSLVAYRGEDNQVWFRAVPEFEDGRFEPAR